MLLRGEGGGGGCRTGVIPPAKHLTTLGSPKGPTCLLPIFMCKPMLHSEAERLANQTATESSASSQHLKEAAVPNPCPQTTDPTERSAIGMFSAAPTPKMSPGEISVPS